MKTLFSLLLFLVIAGGAALAGGYYWVNSEATKPGPTSAETVFTVKSGEGLSAVATRLESEGLIRDERVMKLRARLQPPEGQIKVGEYAIPAGASVDQIMEQLVGGKVVMLKLTIPEGRTTAQILKQIEAAEELTGEMPSDLPEEGALLPDTYLFPRSETRADFIARMEKAQDDLLEELWPQRQDDLPIKSPYEAVKLASIVEKETGRDGERGKIAGLFITRLKRGMRLESDPTIIYGVSKGEPLYNRRGQRRTLYRSEIDTPTEWNTYQIDGLPKTPICNPGRDAIAAVLNPPEVEYIFFVADGKGGHLFAKTLAEHNRNVQAYRRYEAEEIARERSQ